jgi:hypothetical protein
MDGMSPATISGGSEKNCSRRTLVGKVPDEFEGDNGPETLIRIDGLGKTLTKTGISW